MRSVRDVLSRWSDVRPLRNRAAKPQLEPIEGRLLFHAGASGHLSAAVVATPAVLARYRVFEGTISRGPNAGKVTLYGPLVLGYSGRIQVIGTLYQRGGMTISVIGTITGGGVAMTFFVPARGSFVRVLAFGSGQLKGVPGGLPDGLTLVGSGNLEGPDLKRDSGHWATVAPSKAAGG